MTPAITYCVVPHDTEPGALAALREKYAADPLTNIIVDKRAGEDEPGHEVRKLRRPVLRRELPGSEIPGARLEQHMPPVDLDLAELPLEHIVERATKYDPAASSELRWRSYALVLALLTKRLGNHGAAHAATPRVLEAVQASLGTYKPGHDFQRWLIGFVERMPLDA